MVSSEVIVTTISSVLGRITTRFVRFRLPCVRETVPGWEMFSSIKNVTFPEIPEVLIALNAPLAPVRCVKNSSFPFYMQLPNMRGVTGIIQLKIEHLTLRIGYCFRVDNSQFSTL